MAWKLDAIEQMQLPRQRRVDGVGRPNFDFHTGDGDGDASGSARLADYADVEAGGDVRRSRRSSMGGALDSCALTLIPAGEDRPLTLQFDAGSAAASTALRDDWLAALRAAVAAAQADDAASGTV